MRYQPGTLVQRKNGYVFLVTREGKQIAQHRWVASQRLGRDLKKGECVVRKKPDFLNNSWDNLVVVQHRIEKFKYLPESRVIYVPSRAQARGASGSKNSARAGSERSV